MVFRTLLLLSISTAHVLPFNPAIEFNAPNARKSNNETLNKLLHDIPYSNAYGVFDFDGSAINGDISVAMMYTQALYGMYYFPKHKLKESLQPFVKDSECFPDGYNTKLGKDLSGNDVTLERLLDSMSSDYVALYDTIKSRRGNRQPLKEDTAYYNFVAKMGFFNDTLYAYSKTMEDKQCTADNMVAQIPRMWTGMPKDVVIRLAQLAFRENLRDSIGSVSLISSPSSSLRVTGTLYHGIRIYPGTQMLMNAFHQRGVASYIVTAAPKIVIEALLQLQDVKWDVSGVYGVDFEISNDIFTGKVVEGSTYVWRKGKAEVVGEISKRHNHQKPIYALGDSSGDVDMFGTVDKNGIVHVINSLSLDQEYVKYIERGCGNTEKGSAIVLVQGVNFMLGLWRDSDKSTYDQVQYEYTKTKECVIDQGKPMLKGKQEKERSVRGTLH